MLRLQLAKLHKMLLDLVRVDPVCRRLMTAPGVGPVVALTYRCTAPGSLDKRLPYAARLRVWSCQAARMSLGLRWPFFSISHSAL